LADYPEDYSHYYCRYHINNYSKKYLNIFAIINNNTKPCQPPSQEIRNKSREKPLGLVGGEIERKKNMLEIILVLVSLVILEIVVLGRKKSKSAEENSYDIQMSLIKKTKKGC